MRVDAGSSPLREGAAVNAVEALVQRQLDAYTARDVPCFLAPYSDGVREQPFEVAAVYEVADGLIRNAWFYAAD